jgi:Holliday junction resolvase
MYTYKKGYRAEKELIKLLSSLEYAVLRTPKSGKDTIDLIACKRGQIFVFECKFWKSRVRINEKQLKSLIDFSEKAGAIPVIAIKEENEGWKFLRAEDVKENEGNISDDLIKEKSFSVEFFGRY